MISASFREYNARRIPPLASCPCTRFAFTAVPKAFDIIHTANHSNAIWTLQNNNAKHDIAHYACFIHTQWRKHSFAAFLAQRSSPWPSMTRNFMLYRLRTIVGLHWKSHGDSFLPRDAMHKRGLCCHTVSVCLSVCLSRSWITSKRINISSKFSHHHDIAH